ncbi:substrate-binding domain-containing protein [Candidatus Caldatribacterium saccharofermentans]|uniref:substrate-binding domain-containing protein n=1 Tax=Candidatus Caldatribacterium saccharofermentans TaxID=1454753 RepID=UPI003D06B2B3
MKKRWLLIGFVAVLLVLLVGAVFAQEKQKLYFIFVPKLVHPWYEDVIDGIKKAESLLEATGMYDIEWEWLAPQEADVVEHVRKIETAISKKPNGLAVAVLDPGSDVPAIQEALKMGIPTICFDTDAPESGRIGFVGRVDYIADGKEMAEILAKAINYEGEVGILIGSPTAPNHRDRVAGFKEALSKYPNIKIVAELADNDDLEKAIRLTESMLAAHPNLKGIYGCNATAPIGAARAVKDAGKSGQVIVVGMDDLPEMVEFVRDGTVLAMSVQRVKEIGFWSTIYLWALNTGHHIPDKHDTGSFVVYKEDLDVYTQWK